METFDRELNELAEDLSFRDTIAIKFTEEQLANIKCVIEKAAENGKRDYKFFLEKRDVKASGFFVKKYQLVGYGKMVWDQLLQLGFEPRLETWTYFPQIKIEW